MSWLMKNENRLPRRPSEGKSAPSSQFTNLKKSYAYSRSVTLGKISTASFSLFDNFLDEGARVSPGGARRTNSVILRNPTKPHYLRDIFLPSPHVGKG